MKMGGIFVAVFEWTAVCCGGVVLAVTLRETQHGIPATVLDLHPHIAPHALAPDQPIYMLSATGKTDETIFETVNIHYYYYYY